MPSCPLKQFTLLEHGKVIGEGINEVNKPAAPAGWQRTRDPQRRMFLEGVYIGKTTYPVSTEHQREAVDSGRPP